MTTSTTVTHRSLAVLKLPRRTSIMITYAEGVATCVTNNPSFPNPTPTVAALLAAISDLRTAEAAAMSRTKGAVIARNDKRTALVKELEQLRGYVQTVADANAETAATVIASAGLAVRKPTVRPPRVFKSVQGTVSGSAKLVTASAGSRVSYDWESSLDGGKTWVAAPSTLRASTTIAGFTPGVTVLFRYRALTKAGPGNWSQPVSLTVL